MPTGGSTGGEDLQIDGTVSVDITNRPDDPEPVVLCDSGAADRRFLRRFEFPPGGGAPTIVDTDLDGTTAYAVSAEANVTTCGGGGSGCDLDFEFLTLQDSNDALFIRRIETDCDGNETIVDFEIDGTTTFVPVGAVTLACCYDTEIIMACRGSTPIIIVWVWDKSKATPTLVGGPARYRISDGSTGGLGGSVDYECIGGEDDD